jgi:SAM-dependent methyltransferase
MDATQPLAFPDASFDVVNARMMIAFMLREHWPTVVREFGRLTRPGGNIILTESDLVISTNSQAIQRMYALTFQAMNRAGLYGGTDEWQLTPRLPAFLVAAGCDPASIRTTSHTLDYSAGTNAQIPMAKHSEISLELAQPFLVKSGLVSEQECAQLRQQVLIDMYSDTLRAQVDFTTVWGTKAANQE